MKRKTRVYVAGPYTKGDVAVNVRQACLMGDLLLSEGYAPFIPHLTHFLHMLAPRAYEEWLAFDLEWLRTCDVVLRLPGESNGADKEVEEAKRLGMPVYFAVRDLLNYQTWEIES